MNADQPNLVLNVKLPIGSIASIAASGLDAYLASSPMEAHCPQCGSLVEIGSPSVECPSCGLPVNVELE